MQAKNRDFSRFSKDFFQNLNHFSVKLGAGNRLVGIISHVSELKERIDRQVVIQKSNSGSSIQLIS